MTRVKLPTTHCVRDGNVDKTFQDYRAELVHNLYHWFVIILQVTKHEITVCGKIQSSNFPASCHLISSRFTSVCLMVTKRLRISLRMAMASLRVLSWQEQSSTSASPSTACSTVEWGPRSAGILTLELDCSSCDIKIKMKQKLKFMVAWKKWQLSTLDFYFYSRLLVQGLKQVLTVGIRVANSKNKTS